MNYPRGDKSRGFSLPFKDSPYPWTLRLVAITVIVFVFQMLFMRTSAGYAFFERFMFLNPYYFIRGAFWELVTYMFCHSLAASSFLGIPLPMHLVFNMFLLWMFGREVELNLGSKAFLRLFFITGVVAGLCALITGLMTGRSTLGASGAVLGILAAFGHLFPDRIILVFFIIPMRVRYFVWVVAAIDLLGAISGGGSVAHLAHIGGLFSGMILMRTGWYRRPLFDLEGWRRRQAKDRENRVRRRVDALLEKISREGLDSLTKEEREFLERARRRR